ncbi:MAG: rRNA maturation RNase YbeY [Pseudomonadota bacterium]
MTEPDFLELSIAEDTWAELGRKPRSDDVDGGIEQLAATSVRAALEVADIPVDAVIVSILLTNDAQMRQLNRDFRAKDRATNVLSWPSQALEGPFTVGSDLATALHRDDATGRHLLGDVALGFQTVRAEAKDQAKSIEQHAMHLIVHGVLHLLGYDHQIDEDAVAMERCEIEALKRLGWPDPYQVRS